MNKGSINSSKGFTLIEVMIVVAVIGILAVVGVPKYQGIKDHYRLQGSAQKVFTELNYAKQLAMDQRRTTFVLFTNSSIKVMQLINGQYKVLDTKDFETGVTFDPGLNSWLVEINDLVSGVSLGRGLSYNFKGFPSEYGTVLLAHSNGRTIGIELTEQTGSLKIKWP